MSRINPSHPELIHKIILLFFISFVISHPLIATAVEPLSFSDPDRLIYKPLVFTHPKPNRVILNNGLILYIFENHELPLIKITAVIRTGSMYDPLGKEGLAELTGKVMKTGGIDGMSGSVVDEALEEMAVSLHSSIDRDSGTFSLSLLSKDLEKGIDIFSRILQKPVFEEAKLGLAKGLKIEELRRISDQPQKLAFREFGRLMHAASPRGRLATRSSIERIQRDDLIRCHDLFYNPERVMLSISGDIGRMEAEAIVNQYLGMWTSRKEKVAAPPLPHKQEGGIYVILKDIPQSVVIFGWLAPPKNDIQFFPVEIINFITGSGGFRSRIFQEIRTDRGLAYSTGSFYNAKSEYGLFGAYALTKSESTVEVVSLLYRIIRDVGKKSFSPDELNQAKNALVNSFIFSFTSADKIVVQQMIREYDGLPEDYLDTYQIKVSNVTIDDIKKAASYIDPDRAVILIIGNNKVIQEISGSFEKVWKLEGSI
jgi:zinc protease